MAIASIARLAFTAVHGISKVSKVVTAGIFIALVASVEAGISRSADLKKRGDCSVIRLTANHKKHQLIAGTFVFSLCCE